MAGARIRTLNPTDLMSSLMLSGALTFYDRSMLRMRSRENLLCMNHLTSLSLSCSLDAATSGSALLRNILFLIPEPACSASSERELSSLMEMARHVAGHAFVYVARFDQSEMEDDEFGVRHMPLADDCYSAFGLLTKVLVFGDRSLALAVAEGHPEAEVLLIHSSHSYEILGGEAGFHAAPVPSSMAA